MESPPAPLPEFQPNTEDGKKKKLVTQDTLESPSLSQTPSMSSEDPLSPVILRKYSIGLNLFLIVITVTQLYMFFFHT